MPCLSVFANKLLARSGMACALAYGIQTYSFGYHTPQPQRQGAVFTIEPLTQLSLRSSLKFLPGSPTSPLRGTFIH